MASLANGAIVVNDVVNTTTFVPQALQVPSTQLSQIVSAASVVLMHEHKERRYLSYTRPTINVYDGVTTTYMYFVESTYGMTHFDGSNMLYCDGHVKWKKQTNMCASDFGFINPSTGCGFRNDLTRASDQTPAQIDANLFTETS